MLCHMSSVMCTEKETFFYFIATGKHGSSAESAGIGQMKNIEALQPSGKHLHIIASPITRNITFQHKKLRLL